jgi:ComF family protein
MNLFRAVVEDTLALVYPNLCVACGKTVPARRYYLCTGCLHDLPRTHFHRDPANPLAMTFWGRVRLEHAAAWFHYTRGSRYSRLIHAMKYLGRKDIGYELGRLYATELAASPLAEAQLVIPVPLHPKKQRKRGFNQSEWIGRGIAEGLHLPMAADNLYRAVHTRTQTRKSRIERWQNVARVFRLKKPHLLENRHILLVDDVVTTGATMESCAGVLLECPGARVSLAALGYASQW